MANDENKEVIRQYWNALTSRDAKGAAAFWAADATNHGMKLTREGLQLLHESLLQVYENWTIHEMISEGSWVVCRVVAQGRHKAQPPVPFDSGIWRLTKPDGRPFSFQHIHMFRVEDGKVREHWANRDDLGAARQLGLELKPADRSP